MDGDEAPPPNLQAANQNRPPIPGREAVFGPPLSPEERKEFDRLLDRPEVNAILNGVLDLGERERRGEDVPPEDYEAIRDLMQALED